MLNLILAFMLDVSASTLAVTYIFSPNTLAQSSQVNQNFDDVEAVVNALTSTNYAADSVNAAALNGDVVRATYGLIQHTDGSLYVDVSDTNPCLELTDGGLRVKVDGATIGRGSSGLLISVTSQAQGDILYFNGTSWVRLAAGTTGYYLQTQGAAANPQWAAAGIPAHYRDGLNVMQASTTTMTVAPGILEVNGQTIAKTANTTLTITAAGNWAGGVSLQATNTTAYIGVDSSGNIKMHTTAPSHGDYALSITAANITKRYVSWSSTTYRVIGWFRMNGAGSGELDTYGVSNLADGNAKNVVESTTGAVATGSTTIPFDDTIPQNTEGDQYMSLNFVPTNVNNKLRITVVFNGAIASGEMTVALFQDSTANALKAASQAINAANVLANVMFTHTMKAATTSLTTFKVRMGAANAGTNTFNGISSGRKYGGVMASSITVEEIESQLT